MTTNFIERSTTIATTKGQTITTYADIGNKFVVTVVFVLMVVHRKVPRLRLGATGLVTYLMGIVTVLGSAAG